MGRILLLELFVRHWSSMRIANALLRRQRLLRKLSNETCCAEVALWRNTNPPNCFACTVHVRQEDCVQWMYVTRLRNYVPLKSILYTNSMMHSDTVRVKISMITPVEADLLHWNTAIGRNFFDRGFLSTLFVIPNLKHRRATLQVRAQYVKRDGDTHTASPLYIYTWWLHSSNVVRFTAWHCENDT